MGRQSGCDLIKCLRSLTSCAVRVSVGAVIWSLDWRGWHTRCLWPSGLASCLHADTGKEQSETTPSTAPSFPQERVGRGRCAGGGNLPLSCNLILQVAACDFCSHSRGGDNRMAWMQGGGITGAHFIYLFIYLLEPILKAAHHTQNSAVVVACFTSLEWTEAEEKGESLKSKTPLD